MMVNHSVIFSQTEPSCLDLCPDNHGDHRELETHIFVRMAGYQCFSS